MKCEHCENEATVHEVTVRNGVKVEKHLCEECAAKEGLSLQHPASPAELIKMVMEPTAKKALSAKSASCPRCGMTFEEFRQSGLLGCEECYAVFESRLAPLIERAHEGAAQHVGKSPPIRTDPSAKSRLAAAVEERVQRVEAMRRMLEDAVKGEDYERAARLRDELRKLTDSSGSGAVS